MNWQEYVDEQLVGTGKIDKAAIFSLEGTLLAYSAGFHLAPAEIKNLIAAFNNITDIAAHGLFLQGERYNILGISPERNTIQARKGVEGIVAIKTRLSVVLGHYKEDMTGMTCHSLVETVATYLTDNGY